MPPRADVSEERKTQILDAAMDTFAQKGIHKTRMSDIAERSGLSKGSLYWYFDSKDSIILNLMQRIFEPEIKDLEKLLSDPRPTSERILIYAERGGTDIVNLLKWMPLIYDFIALAFRQDLIRKTVSLYYQKNIQLLEKLIQQGIDSGEFQEQDPLDILERIKINLHLLLEGLKTRE